MESPTIKHSPLPPPKVIKSILKKNKHFALDNDYRSTSSKDIQNLSQERSSNTQYLQESVIQSNLHEDYSTVNQNISNGHVTNVHLNSDQDICINDTSRESKKEKFNKNVQNGIASKAIENLHTVQVDIH